MASKDYIKLSNTYIKDVLSGKIPACQYVKHACERQKNDLKRKDLPYKFDKTRAEKVCKFIEVLPHIKGIWAGKPITLEPWQIFLLTTVFGWVDKEGRRRFKTAYTEVPRKNAKSTLSSGVALYLLTADGEGGPEVYSAATTRDQAKIVWEDAKRMVDRCAPLREYFGVQTSAHSVFVPGNAGVLKALARDQGGNLDGLNIHGAIVDELHAHKTREVWDVLETATGARSQPLIWGITTAGFNRTGICYEQRAYTIKLLDKVHVDEEYFGIIYTIDDTDDWADPKSWAKANPNWGVSVSPDDIARKARKAMEMAAATNNFLTKHLNVWVNADTAWMDMRAWDACADHTLKLEDFIGQPCYIGCDLATKNDVAAALFLFPKDGLFYVFGKYYLNEDAAEGGRNSHYQGWNRQGLFTLTPGNVTDFDYIEEDLEEIARHHTVEKMGIDPYQAIQLINRLRAKGVPVEEYQQQVRYMSEPMKQLEALVRSGKLRHNGDPVLTWMISNVVCHMDAKENIYPRKEFNENKIDGAVALIIALGEYMTTQEDDSPYEDRGILFL
jgi:phage terminase large subunit-like protein